jgi:hypothetical protein
LPNYGKQGREAEELRDWLLGGNRKRQILECLSDPPEDGWSAEALSRDLQIGPATVYEVFRALRGASLLETVRARRYRLASGTDLADTLRALVVVLRVDGRKPIERPPRSRRR